MVKKKASEENITPLAQHKTEGKKLIPPFASLNMQRRSWVNDALPEVLWATIVITHLPREEALDIFREVSDRLGSFTQGLERQEVIFDATHSGLKNLKEEQARQIIGIICYHAKVRKLLRSMLFYKELPLYDLWKESIDQKPEKEDWEILKIAISKTLFHQSQEATDCRWLKILFFIKFNVFLMPSEQRNEIVGYPDVGDIRAVRPSIRATELMHDTFIKKDNWCDAFWDASLRLTACEGLERASRFKPPPSKELIKKVNKYFIPIYERFFLTLSTTKTNPKHDAVFGLLLYSWRLTAEAAFYTSDLVSGRLALRAITESYIMLKYLTDKDDPDTWSTYRAHGIGQAKLVFLKLKDLNPQPIYMDMDLLQAIVNEDAWVEFVSINLGHWDNLDLRRISIQTGTKDIYDKYYTGLSTYNHGQWNAVRETVFQTCQNTLHRLHRVPWTQDFVFNDLTDDAFLIMEEMLKLMEKTYPKLTSPKKPRKRKKS